MHSAVNRIYLLQYARHVSSKHLREKRNEFIVGADDTEEEEFEGETIEEKDNDGLRSNLCFAEDGDSGFSPSPAKSCPDTTDSSQLSSSGPVLDLVTSRHSVISRKDNIILSPEGLQEAPQEDTHKVEDIAEEEAAEMGDMSPNTMAVRRLVDKELSAATFQREFQLSDVLDYVKTGVASIIEDEVTQRFEGEELRSWNLLTRTNHNFRFINWKLTFFWGFGCFFRYCILLPGRMAIFIVGVGRFNTSI